MTDAYLDISDCCSHHANEAIDDLFLKAVSDPPDDEIWQKHQSVYIRRIIEMFTARGLQRLSSFHTEAAKWLDANRKANGRPTDRPASGMRWWSPGEMFLVGEYLQAIPSSDLTVDDWMMLGDYLAQKYMAVDDLEAEASWLAYRSTLMGRVQYDAPDLTEGQSDMVLSALPMTQAEASKQFDLPSYLNQLMDFGRVRCAEMVVALADKARTIRMPVHVVEKLNKPRAVCERLPVVPEDRRPRGHRGAAIQAQEGRRHRDLGRKDQLRPLSLAHEARPRRPDAALARRDVVDCRRHSASALPRHVGHGRPAEKRRG
jgi:hypothetical protein